MAALFPECSSYSLRHINADKLMHPCRRLLEVHPEEIIPICSSARDHTFIPIRVALSITDLREWLYKAVLRRFVRQSRDEGEAIVVDDCVTELCRQGGLQIVVGVLDYLTPGPSAVVV